MGRFLVVDANPADRERVAQQVQEAFPEAEIVGVENRQQWEAALEGEAPRGVVTEYRLPWTDGLEVLAALRRRFPNCPVVMFTGAGDEMTAVRGMKAGLDDYLPKKPENYPLLADALRRAVENAATRGHTQEAECRYQRLFDELPLGFFRMERNGKLLEVNSAATRILHYPDRETLLAHREQERFLGVEDDASIAWPAEVGATAAFVTRLQCYDGTRIWADINVRLVREEGAGLFLEGSLQDVTERQEHTRHLAAMTRITRMALQQEECLTGMRILGEQLRHVFEADSCYITYWDAHEGKVVPKVAVGYAEKTYPHMEAVAAENTFTRAVLRENRVVAVENVLEGSIPSREVAEKFPVQAVLALPLRAHGKAFGAALVGFHRPRGFTDAEIRRAEDLAAHISLVLSASSLLQDAQRRVAELESVRRAALQLTSSLDSKTVFDAILRQISNLLHVTNTHIFLYENGRLRFVAGTLRGENIEHPVVEPRRNGVTATVARSGEFLIIENASKHPLFENYPLFFDGAIASFPLKIGGNVVGVLNVSYEEPHRFQASEMRILELLADQAAIAVQNASLYESVQRGYQRLQSLRTIDAAITASMDINITLGVFLTQVMRQLEADAAAVALYDSLTTSLRYVMARGMPQSAFPRGDVRLGLTLSGKVALRKERLVVEEFSAGQNRLDSSVLARIPATYVGMPLVAKGELQGVLEIYRFEPFSPDREWLDFADSLATQAAIAVENSRLFDRLQRFNFELEMAYDQTLEGWARVLELRGVEPQGHTSRLVELTVSFARLVVHEEKRLLDIRRGVLLHDIGKLAIPDTILLKSGELNDSERRIMRQHPEYARRLLEPIHFLRDALEIPYAHHERWDGSGYPRGLVGEQIPLAARLFAIVDVWDALTTERSYRPAWSREKAMRYLSEQAGHLFDPSLVYRFLDLLHTRFMNMG